MAQAAAGQAQLNQAAAVAQAVAAANQVEQSRLPLFYRDPTKDQFDAETWLDRVRNAQRAATWDDDRAAAFAYAALRGGALLWYRVTSKRINLANWALFQEAFLNAFSTTKTTRTTTAIFEGLKQSSNEDTITYYGRVGKAFDDLKEIRPAQAVPANPFPAGWAGEQWNNIADDAKTAAARELLLQGQKYSDSCSSAQYYVAGLRPEYRDRILMNPPADGFVDLWNTARRAREIEQNLTDPLKNQYAAAAIDEVDEVDAINRRKFGGRGRGGFRGRGGRGRGGSSGRFEGECYFCHKKGHIKKDCFSFQKSQGQGRKVAAVEDDREEAQEGHHNFLNEENDNASYIGTLDYLN
jgi:hypothetical protein